MSAAGVAVIGIVLMVLAAVTDIGLLWTIGIIALVVAAVLLVVDLVRRP